MSEKMPKAVADYYKNEIMSFLEQNNKMEMDCEEILKNERLIYCTFGYHDSEPPHSIVRRKLAELALNKNEAIPSLWGVCAKKEKMAEIQEFLDGMNGKDVYVVMNFTRCTEQLKDPNAAPQKLWSEKDLMRDKEALFRFCEISGEKVDLFSKKIFVKGSDVQNAAFVVEDYFLFDGKIAPSVFVKEIYKPYKIVVKGKEKGYAYQEINLLVKDPNANMKMDGDGWAIVLKLKAPYIVECYR